MKWFIFAFIIGICGVAYGAAPVTSCPTGFVAVVEESIKLVPSSCPSGYSSAGTASSCLVTSPSGSCMMFVPSSTSYSDTTGAYQYTEICPLQ